MRKRQRRLNSIDQIALSLTARGLTTGEEARNSSSSDADDLQLATYGSVLQDSGHPRRPGTTLFVQGAQLIVEAS